jgi:hypothetical protein
MSLPATIIAILLTTATLIGAYTLVVRSAVYAIRWTRLLKAECSFEKIAARLFKKNQICST